MVESKSADINNNIKRRSEFSRLVPPLNRLSNSPRSEWTQPIFERDDGRYQVGLDAETAAGPFETRTFAEAVAIAAAVVSP
jgi:hypothetical protein